MSAGMLHRVVRYILTENSGELPAAIIRESSKLGALAWQMGDKKTGVKVGTAGEPME